MSEEESRNRSDLGRLMIRLRTFEEGELIRQFYKGRQNPSIGLYENVREYLQRLRYNGHLEYDGRKYLLVTSK